MEEDVKREGEMHTHKIIHLSETQYKYFSYLNKICFFFFFNSFRFYSIKIIIKMGSQQTGKILALLGALFLAHSAYSTYERMSFLFSSAQLQKQEAHHYFFLH